MKLRSAAFPNDRVATAYMPIGNTTVHSDVIAFVTAVIRLARNESSVYLRFRRHLGHVILLGLELLVAGDIVRTVAIAPTLTSVAILGGIVVIRTFLSFTMEAEITGYWPWQKPPPR